MAGKVIQAGERLNLTDIKVPRVEATTATSFPVALNFRFTLLAGRFFFFFFAWGRHVLSHRTIPWSLLWRDLACLPHLPAARVCCQCLISVDFPDKNS